MRRATTCTEQNRICATSPAGALPLVLDPRLPLRDRGSQVPDLPCTPDWYHARLAAPVRRPVPAWAVQFAVGLVLVLVAVGVFAALLGAAVRGPTAFFDELGKNVARLGPSAQPDIRDDAQLKAVIRAMPDGKLRVGSVVEDRDQVVFTITAPRAAVHALVKPGDELRIARDGSVEVVPTGIPGVLDQLQRSVEDLKRRFFGP